MITNILWPEFSDQSDMCFQQDGATYNTADANLDILLEQTSHDINFWARVMQIWSPEKAAANVWLM